MANKKQGPLAKLVRRLTLKELYGFAMHGLASTQQSPKWARKVQRRSPFVIELRNHKPRPGRQKAVKTVVKATPESVVKTEPQAPSWLAQVQ